MPGYGIITAVGRVAATEWDQILTPREPWNGCCVIVCHGSGAQRAIIDPIGQPSTLKLCAAIATAGIPVIGGDFGLQTWGNDTVMARIDAAWTLAKATFSTIRRDKFILLGGSMGGAAVARYSQLHPDLVAGVIGLIPLWDLLAFYAANVAGSQAEIAAAWGVSTGAALPTGADIANRTTPVAGIPHLVGYSAVDGTVLPAWTLPYTRKVNSTVLVTDNQFGHSDAAIGGMPVSTVTNFVKTYGHP